MKHHTYKIDFQVSSKNTKTSLIVMKDAFYLFLFNEKSKTLLINNHIAIYKRAINKNAAPLGRNLKFPGSLYGVVKNVC